MWHNDCRFFLEGNKKKCMASILILKRNKKNSFFSYLFWNWFIFVATCASIRLGKNYRGNNVLPISHLMCVCNLHHNPLTQCIGLNTCLLLDVCCFHSLGRRRWSQNDDVTADYMLLTIEKKTFLGYISFYWKWKKSWYTTMKLSVRECVL